MDDLWGKCGSCPHWEAMEKIAGGLPTTRGKCRRFPPVPVHVLVNGRHEIQEIQPVTDRVNWCGEQPDRRANVIARVLNRLGDFLSGAKPNSTPGLIDGVRAILQRIKPTPPPVERQETEQSVGGVESGIQDDTPF